MTLAFWILTTTSNTSSEIRARVFVQNLHADDTRSQVHLHQKRSVSTTRSRFGSKSVSDNFRSMATTRGVVCSETTRVPRVRTKRSEAAVQGETVLRLAD